MNLRAVIAAATVAAAAVAAPARACWESSTSSAATAASEPSGLLSSPSAAALAGRPHAGAGFGPDLSFLAAAEHFPDAAVASFLAKPTTDVPTLSARVHRRPGSASRHSDAFVADRAAVKRARDYALAKLHDAHLAPPTRTHEVVVTDAYTSEHNGVTHVYLVQYVDGMEVSNGVANVNIGRDGQIISFSSSFFREGSGAAVEDPTFVDQSETHAGPLPGHLARRGGEVPRELAQELLDDMKELLPDDAEGLLDRMEDMLPGDIKDLFPGANDDEESNPHGRHHQDNRKVKSSGKDRLRSEIRSKPYSTFGPPPSVSGASFISPMQALSVLADHLGRRVAYDDLDLIPYHTFQTKTRDDPDYLILRMQGNPNFSLFSGSATVAAAGTPDTVPASFKLLINSHGELVPVWDLKVDLGDHWFHAHVDARMSDDGGPSNSVMSLVDWVSDAAYTVFPLGTNDPDCGDRVEVFDPAHPVASPLGWHDQGVKNYTVTIGNNVFAQENLNGRYEWERNGRPDGTKKLVFDFPVDFKQDPSEYLDAAVTNLFYWNNAIHDLFYVYGFNERSGNFQENNLDRGGKGGDAVAANAQDGSGYNNANFATPPDGFRGKMRMYVWDATDPMRDGDLEGGIIMHEYAHGISTRLTGGPANSGCLGWGEAGGMGEGWGDYFATILRMTANSTRNDTYGMGTYSSGADSIRKFLYSTSFDVNPSTYAYVNRPGYWGVHAKGEVWAEILYEVYWNLVDAHGFNPDWFDTGADAAAVGDAAPGPDGTYRDFRTGRRVRRDPAFTATKPAPGRYAGSGNILALQLVVDGLKLQPCNPSFVAARDAIMTADDVLTGGASRCLLWRAFAKRGLGAAAAAPGRESFTLPDECEDDGTEA
ncbi:Fungalysin/Thermolysin Extracellular metalloproteinase 5, partial [Cladochytrium tenue]